MSAGGFIAQAVLGGTQSAAQGIGNKIREEAKLKRQQALEGTRTIETMKRQAHESAMARGENEQRHGMTMEQENAQNQNARGRLRLADELDQRNYEDVTNESGKIIGQRETDSNQLTPFTSKTTGDLSDRQKLAIESLNAEIKSIYKGAEAMGGSLTPDAQDRIDRLILQRNQMLYGGGKTPFTSLMEGQDGGRAEPSGQAAPAEPGNMKGLINAQRQQQQANKTGEAVTKQIEAIESEAEQALTALSPNREISSAYGRPSGTQRPSVSQQIIESAQATLEKIYQVTQDPDVFAAMSDRQKSNLAETIREIEQRLGALQQ